MLIFTFSTGSEIQGNAVEMDAEGNSITEISDERPLGDPILQVVSILICLFPSFQTHCASRLHPPYTLNPIFCLHLSFVLEDFWIFLSGIKALQ